MTVTKQPSPGAVLTVEERARRGRLVRERVPRSVNAEWAPGAGRVDPVSALAEQEVTRLPELLPIRHERMSASPFAFYRGAAVIMAADLAGEPRTGLEVQLCGDAHLANFGTYAAPDRGLLFDINDFDETLPGPFEWDLKRLVASFEIASRSNGFDEHARRATVTAAVVSYCTAMGEFATLSDLDLWYSRLTVEGIASRWGAEASKSMLRSFQHMVEKAESKDRLLAYSKLTTLEDGEPRFVSHPPLLERARELVTPDEYSALTEEIHAALGRYRSSLQRDRRRLFDRYRFVDLARKVVGVGSVGTRCWVALMIGRDTTDPLFLQVKEADASVLEPYLARSTFAQHGQRVVEGQRLTQAASDILLGWMKVDGVDGRQHDYYCRQLWDAKGSAPVEKYDPRGMALYAQVCGYTLARAHARSGDPIAIAAYVGGGKTLARALATFAAAYADQNEADFHAFTSRPAA